jgi:hypothetical protein
MRLILKPYEKSSLISKGLNPTKRFKLNTALLIKSHPKDVGYSPPHPQGFNAPPAVGR